jgi:hypothetical protein
MTMTPKTIKLTPAVSNKPCDIEYRLKRAHALASECRQFLEGIDTGTPIGIRLQEAQGLAGQVEQLVSEMRSAAPAKRIHGKKAKAAAGIVEEPKAPKGKRGRKAKAAPTPTLDEVLEAVEEQLDAAAE